LRILCFFFGGGVGHLLSKDNTKEREITISEITFPLYLRDHIFQRRERMFRFIAIVMMVSIATSSTCHVPPVLSSYASIEDYVEATKSFLYKMKHETPNDFDQVLTCITSSAFEDCPVRFATVPWFTVQTLELRRRYHPMCFEAVLRPFLYENDPRFNSIFPPLWYSLIECCPSYVATPAIDKYERPNDFLETIATLEPGTLKAIEVYGIEAAYAHIHKLMDYPPWTQHVTIHIPQTH